MSSYFRESRNLEISTLEYIETSLNASWSGITTVKTFTDAYAKDIALPIVCVSLNSTINNRYEVGSKTLWNQYNIVIDIFAKSHAQRLDLADFIIDKLKDGWTYYVYAHAVGDNTTLTKTDTGHVNVASFIQNAALDFGMVENPKDKYRHILSVNVRKSI